ncbi:hypothetical protein Tco_1052807 [Tanacetum coccineum]
MVVHTAASCTFFLLTGWFLLAVQVVFLLVVILLAGCFVSAGCVFLLFAWFLLLVDSFCWLNTFMLLELFMLSIHLFMLLNWFVLFDIAGWLVSATSHLVSAVLSLILLVGWSLPLVTQFLLVVSNPAGVTMYLLNE